MFTQGLRELAVVVVVLANLRIESSIAKKVLITFEYLVFLRISCCILTCFATWTFNQSALVSFEWLRARNPNVLTAKIILLEIEKSSQRLSTSIIRLISTQKISSNKSKKREDLQNLEMKLKNSSPTRQKSIKDFLKRL